MRAQKVNQLHFGRLSDHTYCVHVIGGWALLGKRFISSGNVFSGDEIPFSPARRCGDHSPGSGLLVLFSPAGATVTRSVEMRTADLSPGFLRPHARGICVQESTPPPARHPPRPQLNYLKVVCLKMDEGLIDISEQYCEFLVLRIKPITFGFPLRHALAVPHPIVIHGS